MKVVTTPLNLTIEVVDKLLPVITTSLFATPLVGEKLVIVGGGGRTVKSVELVTVPPDVVTVILPLVALGGIFAVN